MSATAVSNNNSNSNSSSESSPSNSISLIKLDELSSFGATKQSRLPALIKLNDQNNQQVASSVQSMPDFSVSQSDKTVATDKKQQRSLPVVLSMQQHQQTSAEEQSQQAEKENLQQVANETQDSDSEFQVVDMQHEDEEESSQDQVLIGPSLPHMPGKTASNDQQQVTREQIDKSINALQSSLQLGQSTHLGDSLIEMIINLRNENQNLIRALETNNDYVKERLSEFKRVQEDSKKREAQFAREKAEFEHQIRKLQRQNSVLSERLKSMEAKLKDMKLEVSESLNAASSSKTSSIRDESATNNLYPLIDTDSFNNEALERAAESSSQDDDDDDPHQATTMQVDAASGELLNAGDQQDSSQMDTGASRIANMSKDDLSKHFDARKVDFYAIDDPMQQCDKLEQQLNNIGKRDYEICLLQQQLNIYRQDFRLERMEKLEAKIQIEKLKNDIDRLCLERLQQSSSGDSGNEQAQATGAPEMRSSGRRISDGLGRLGHQLTKKAAKQAAKAAKYAAKQAHLEEKAAAALARVAAARAGTTTSGASQPTSVGQQQATIPKETGQTGQPAYHNHHHHHHGRHHRHHRHHSSADARPPRGSGIRSEVVNDLLSTANKAMLTGYKMASTHVNLALDKLSQYEQQQASQLEKNKQQAGSSANNAASTAVPSAPVEHPSID